METFKKGKHTLSDILQSIEDNVQMTEIQIDSLLSKLAFLSENEDSIAYQAEVMAFAFVEEYPLDNNYWNTYFGPKVSWPKEDGTVMEFPSISKVDEALIEYWKQRANDTKNLILKARYLGLVWDFTKTVLNVSPEINIAHSYIGCLVQIAERDIIDYELGTIKKLRRALDLSLRIKHDEFVLKVKKAIIDFEDLISNRNSPGNWVFAFDLLVGKRGIVLTKEEEGHVISSLESRMAKLSRLDEDKIDPWSTENIGKRLADYYRKQNQDEDVHRVLLQIENAYLTIIDTGSPLQIMAWFEGVHILYRDFGFREDAERIAIELKNRGKSIKDEMGTVSSEIKIPRDQLDSIVEAIVSGDIEEICLKIVGEFTPKKEENRKSLMEMSKKFPIQYLVTQKIHDSHGRLIATIPPLQEDAAGHLVKSFYESMNFRSFLLAAVVNKAVEEEFFTAEAIMKFISKSAIIEEERMAFYQQGITLYLGKEFVPSIHILVPQIENSMRNLIEISGGNIYRPSRQGGFNLRSFHDILDDPAIEATLNEDVRYYFKVLYIDPRGWNLRNKIAHGAMEIDEFNRTLADWVFHSMLCLGCVRSKNTD